MKVFVLLALAAAACAAPPANLGGAGIPKSISFNPDGSIVISVDNGAKQVVIRKRVGLDGEPEVDVSVSGPFINPQWWQLSDSPTPKENSVYTGYEDVDYLREKRAPASKTTKTKSQTDVLNGILKDFTGPVDEPTYQKLLAKLNKSVMKGELSPSIYQIFQGLDQPADTAATAQTAEPSLWSQYLSGQGLNLAGQPVAGQTAPGQGLAASPNVSTIPWAVTKSAFVDFLRQQIAQQQLQQLVQQVLQEVQKAQQAQLAAQQAWSYPATGPYAPSGDYLNSYPVNTVSPVQRPPIFQGVGVVPQQRPAGFPYPGVYAPNYPVGQY